uniref:J domain-containing protein n=1 Tax=Compsopogon caeruleus TaxID=31354 RepID=A0A7S1T9N4_9RHOD|mmetsp:Transcript_13352/g.27122  ORF Transcript_13352/g.27122 Transcript_13352/m.27122 type:complete len:498 (+) Transcript_13352:130-1623(+)
MPSTCYYELLGVNREASEGEIKVAYRRLALLWHPDKVGRDQDVDEATARFQGLQEAYSVLSDPDERSWYDSHREQILRDKDEDEDEEKHASSLNLYRFFSASVFRGYQDTKGETQNFYSVYSGVFDTLAQEERDASRSKKDSPAGSESCREYPAFGSSDTPWAAVREFYTVWEAFSSVKEFRWADRWNLAEAPNREVRRLMEKENRKERNNIKKEFNILVRKLVAHVKRLDLRVAERQKEEAQEKARKLAESEERAREDEQARAARASQQRIEREEFIDREMGETLDALIEDMNLADGIDEEPEEEDLYCSACGKRFKSEAQWINHKKSKKHLERLRELAEELGSGDEETKDEVEEEAEAIHLPAVRRKKGAKKKKRGRILGDSDIVDLNDDEGNGETPGTQNLESHLRAPGSMHDMETILNDNTEIDRLPQVEKDATPLDQETTKSNVRKPRRRKGPKSIESSGTNLQCIQCGQEFPSRNKLHLHIAEENHASPLV